MTDILFALQLGIALVKLQKFALAVSLSSGYTFFGLLLTCS